MSIGDARTSAHTYARLWKIAKWVTALSVIGHMGRNLIEGLTWWVWLVDVYHRLVTPVAEVFGKVLQTPLVWMASLFDISLSLPAYPLWGIDILALTALAMRMLGGGGWRIDDKRFEVTLTVIITTLLGIAIFLVLALPPVYYESLTALLLVLCYALIGVTLVLIMLLTSLTDDEMPKEGGTGLAWEVLKATVFWPHTLAQPAMPSRRMYAVIMTRKALETLLRWAPVFLFGSMVLLLNSYADVTLPIVERFAAAWDAMIQDWMARLS